ncbi:MAG: transglutaminase domain-containing protein [Pirellulales bacterium]|nr:transglutaminase domain-containing protein [Pirellulales bacterium]
MPTRLAICCWILLAGVAITPASASDDKPAQRNVRLTYTCDLAKLPVDAKVVDLWIPIPSDNERQTIRLVNGDALGPGRITVDKKFGNRMYYRRFTAADLPGADSAGDNRAPLKVEFVYDVEVREATVAAAKELISTRQETPAPEFAPYLGDSSMIPIQGRITALASEMNLPPGEPLRAGRKIYDYLIDTMVYNYVARGAGTGNAVWACDSKTGDCTDYHSVFIGVCRSRGIPADHVFGLPIPPDKPEGIIKFCHCWARFWVADVGWIPIDASRADKYPADREYYFGTLGSTWITLAHGRDVVLEPPQQGKPINMFDEPYAEVDGHPLAHVAWQGHYQDRPATPPAP